MKSTNSNLFLIACIVGLLFSGCAPVYVSNRLNTPLFDDAGQANIGVGYGVDGLSLNGAFSIVNSVAFIGNYSHKNRQEDPSYKFEHSIGEFGVGFFGSMPLKSEKEHFFYEGFLGYGIGQSNALDTGLIYYKITESKYAQLFLQPNIGYRINNFAMAFSIRMNFINFNHLEIEKKNSLETYTDSKARLDVVAGTLYGWFDPIRIGIQAGLSSSLHTKNEDIDLDSDHIVLNLSVEYTFRGKKAN